MTIGTRDVPPARRRGMTETVGLAALLALAQPVVASAARADDLPAQLLAASREIPVEPHGRQVCIPITGLANDLRTPSVLVDRGEVGGTSEGYSASTVGAYLGDGPTGAPAPPFVQALLDAGAARRIPMSWTQHLRVPTGYPPQLTDTGTVPSAAPPPRPAYEDRDITFHGDAYIVGGEDAELFAHDRNDFLAPIPPAVASAAEAGSTAQEAGSGAPPRGVWKSSRVCYEIVPGRTLEYGEVVELGNGFKEVGAAVLFHPTRVPTWISDPRVIDTLQPNMKPLDVRMLVFRFDGEAWHWLPGGVARFPSRTHIVADDAR